MEQRRLTVAIDQLYRLLRRFEKGKVNDSKYGWIGSYHVDILAEVLQDWDQS